MRVKRRSKNRKVVKFYATCFGFREPYRVLVDGTFVHHLLHHRLLPADDALQSLLSASRPPPLFTSKCVLAELRRLGKSHADAFDAAALLATAKCEHDKVVSAVDCVLSLIGEKNPEHFFVATQDSDLRAKLREVPGVPVIYGLKSSLFIEQPSVQQRKFAQLDEEKRLHMSKSEYQKLLKVPLDGKTATSENASDDEKNRRPISSLVENALGVTDKSKFKKKRPKGPNPLSCKKKKPKPQLSAAQNQGPKADGEAKRKRVRKRKRSHKDSKQTETVRPQDGLAGCYAPRNSLPRMLLQRVPSIHQFVKLMLMSKQLCTPQDLIRQSALVVRSIHQVNCPFCEVDLTLLHPSHFMEELPAVHKLKIHPIQMNI